MNNVSVVIISVEKCECGSFRRITYHDNILFGKRIYHLIKEHVCHHKWVECSVKEFQETLGVER